MAEVYDLIERAHRGEKEARDQLVYENTGLVWSVVRRFAYTGAEKEELFQIGVIGLLKAIDRFDTSYDVCFSTYAVRHQWRTEAFLRDDGPMKVSRSIMDNQRKIRAFTEQWEQRQKKTQETRELSMEELVQGTGLSKEDIILAQGSARPGGVFVSDGFESQGSQLQLIDQLAGAGGGL